MSEGTRRSLCRCPVVTLVICIVIGDIVYMLVAVLCDLVLGYMSIFTNVYVDSCLFYMTMIFT